MRRPIAVLATLSALATLAACGGSDGATRTDEPLRPASEISSSAAAAAAESATLGEKFDLSDNVSVTVSDPVVMSDRESNYLQVTVSLTNNAAKTGSTPTVALLCANSADLGGTLSGGTVTGERDFPARSTMDGTMLLLLPGDTRTAGTPVTCTAPAFITVTPWAALVYDNDKPVQTRIPLADDLLAQLNQPT